MRQAGMREWAERGAGAFSLHDQHGFFDGVQTADALEPIITPVRNFTSSLFTSLRPAASFDGLRRCAHGELDEVIHLLLFFGLDVIVGIELSRLQ